MHSFCYLFEVGVCGVAGTHWRGGPRQIRLPPPHGLEKRSSIGLSTERANTCRHPEFFGQFCTPSYGGAMIFAAS